MIRYNLSHLILPGLVITALLVYDLVFLFAVDHGRDFNAYITDVRRINDYCNWYLGFTSILVGLLAGRLAELRQSVGLVPLSPFIVALLAASVNMLFMPVPYRQDLLWPVRLLWAYHVVLEQTVVVFTAYGLMLVMLSSWRTFASPSTASPTAGDPVPAVPVKPTGSGGEKLDGSSTPAVPQLPPDQSSIRR